MSVQPVNRSSNSVGFSLRKVVVEQVVLSKGLAICKEVSTKHKVEISLLPIRVRTPEVGEVWIVDQTYGFWSFAAILQTPAQFATGFGVGAVGPVGPASTVPGPQGIPGIGEAGPAGGPGPTGPTGATGASGGFYVHNQLASATVWDIYHSLPYTPNVLIVDTTGETVYGDVQVISITHIQAVFSAQFSGTAYLS